MSLESKKVKSNQSNPYNPRFNPERKKPRPVKRNVGRQKMKTLYLTILPFFFSAILLVGCVANTQKKQIPNDALKSVSNKEEYPDYAFHKVDPGTHTTNPRCIYNPVPPFPPELIGVMKSGEAVVFFVIESDGTTSHIQVSEATNRFFAEAAINTIGQWRFEPATIDGKPVAVASKQKVNFRP